MYLSCVYLSCVYLSCVLQQQLRIFSATPFPFIPGTVLQHTLRVQARPGSSWLGLVQLSVKEQANIRARSQQG